MITEDDSHTTLEFDDHYAILSPNLLQNGTYQGKGEKVPEGFRFSSENNPLWYTGESFLRVLRESGLLA
jgi:UDP-N-acetylglucosamine 4,6-dehydratase